MVAQVVVVDTLMVWVAQVRPAKETTAAVQLETGGAAAVVLLLLVVLLTSRQALPVEQVRHLRSPEVQLLAQVAAVAVVITHQVAQVAPAAAVRGEVLARAVRQARQTLAAVGEAAGLAVELETAARAALVSSSSVPLVQQHQPQAPQQ